MPRLRDASDSSDGAAAGRWGVSVAGSARSSSALSADWRRTATGAISASVASANDV